jgi:hypothetical protein
LNAVDSDNHHDRGHRADLRGISGRRGHLGLKLRRITIGALILISALVAMPIPANAVTPTVANTAGHSCDAGGGGVSSCMVTLTVANIGDTVAVALDWLSNGAGVTAGVQTISGGGITFVSQRLDTFVYCPAPTCGLTPFYAGEQIWSGAATSTGMKTFTVSWVNAMNTADLEAWDMTSVPVTAVDTQTGECAFGIGCGATAQTTASSPLSPGLTLAISTVVAGETIGASSTGFTKISTGATSTAGQYSTTASSVASPTHYAIATNSACLPNGCEWGTIGATFGVVLTGPFTVVITNKDAGSYLIPQGKFYDFQATVASSSIAGVNYLINDVKVRFNDSVNIVVVEYNNSTQTFSVNSGNSFISLGSGGVTSSILAGVRTIVIHFSIALTSLIIDSKNRGIELYASNSNGDTRGFEYVQKNYFNILNQGGQVETKVSGLCSAPVGADIFQTICQYQASPKSWIAENSTWYKLQAFQAQFSIKLANNYGNSDSFLWQDYPNSNAGAENSTNPGDWKINVGLYYYDNTTWVKGINAVITMLKGDQGTVDEWTQYNVQWYNGNTFVENTTSGPVVNWIEQNPLSQTSLWVNLWYSNNNASTSEGGRVSAYYTGMHNSGYLWWSSWSPLVQNSTSSQAFLPLLDHTGKTMSVTQALFTKVYMNMSRPGAPAVHTGQVNFQVITRAFQVQDFLRTNGPMAAVDTPVFNPAVIPIIQNTGFFSPIIKAIQYIATLFLNGLQYLGTVIWTGLGARFPWFTNALGTFATLVVSFATLIGQIAGYLSAFLIFMTSAFGPVITIMTVIGQAWATIQGIYLPIFTGANLSAMITIVVLWIFSGYIIEAAEKEDTGAFIRLATGAWHVTQTILFWTWALAKVLIDTIEGLIP